MKRRPKIVVVGGGIAVPATALGSRRRRVEAGARKTAPAI